MPEQKLTLPITGMTCANCAATIERVVKKLDGVAAANVNFAAESAAVAFDPRQLQLQDVVAKIQKSGFGVTTTRVEMPVTGMTCANCAATIERTLNKKVSGVVDAAVNFASERVLVEYVPGVLDVADIVGAIEKAGLALSRRKPEPTRKISSSRHGMPKLKIRPANLRWVSCSPCPCLC